MKVIDADRFARLPPKRMGLPTPAQSPCRPLLSTHTGCSGVLGPGASLSAPLIVAIPRNVATVPASPVKPGSNGDYVYVVGDGNKVTRVDVQ